MTEPNNNNGAAPPGVRAPLRQLSTIDDPLVKTGLLGSSFNLVNSIVGAGIIGIPFAIHQSGLVAGILLLITVSVFTDKSLRLIVDLAFFHPLLQNLHVVTFEDLMSIPFGKAGLRFILGTMLILAYGAMLAYMMIIKDTVPTVLGLGDSFLEREVVMALTTAVVMLPLSLMRDISSLAFTSALSVAADVILMLIVVIHAPISEAVGDAGGFGSVLGDNLVNGGLFIGLGVLSTAMACQHSAFLVAGGLEDRSVDRWSKVTGRSLTVAGAMTLVLGVFGFLGYLDETEGNILNNFDTGSTAINAGRTLLAVTMFFTYPMESFVARHVIVQLFYAGNTDNLQVGPNGELLPENKWMGIVGRREKVTILLYLAVLVPALFLDDLGPVLSLTGSVGGSAIAYIAPGLVYLGVHGGEFKSWLGSVLHNQGYRAEFDTKLSGEVEMAARQHTDATIQASAAGPATGKSGKPFWYYLTGMPIWVAIASSGQAGTKRCLEDLGLDYTTAMNFERASKTSDFYYSIVFIVFGVVAAVLGVASNIYVQVHNIFFSPH